MNDFLNTHEILKNARQVADNILTTLEKLLDDKSKPVKEEKTNSNEEIYRPLYEEYRRRWEAVSEELEEAWTALKLFMDGEVNKTWSVTAEKLNALEGYTVETFWTDPVDAPMQLNIKQRKR